MVFLLMNILTDDLLKQCLRKKILYQYFVVFCPPWAASPLKTFYMLLHNTKRKMWKRRWLSAILKWMLMDMSLPKFDISPGTGYTKSCINSWCPHFFSKKIFCLMSDMKFTLSDVTSFLSDNQSGLKKSCIKDTHREKAPSSKTSSVYQK